MLSHLIQKRLIYAKSVPEPRTTLAKVEIIPRLKYRWRIRIYWINTEIHQQVILHGYAEPYSQSSGSRNMKGEFA